MKIAYVRTGGGEGGGGAPDQCVRTAYRGGEGGSKIGKFLRTYFMDGPKAVLLFFK